jgi:predicted nucleic acid-binding protein
LEKVGHFELLRTGVAEVFVPDAVFAEVSARGPVDPVVQRIQSTAWVKIVVAPPTPPRVLRWGLGDGESSVLTIALGDPESECALDDRDARRCAKALRLDVRGTLGLVLLAKQIGSLAAARPVVERLRQAGLFLSDQIAEQALALVGESP